MLDTILRTHKSIEVIEELNIGHSIIAAALFEGLENAVSRMRDTLLAARE